MSAPVRSSFLILTVKRMKKTKLRQIRLRSIYMLQNKNQLILRIQLKINLVLMATFFKRNLTLFYLLDFRIMDDINLYHKMTMTISNEEILNRKHVYLPFILFQGLFYLWEAMFREEYLKWIMAWTMHFSTGKSVNNSTFFGIMQIW